MDSAPAPCPPNPPPPPRSARFLPPTELLNSTRRHCATAPLRRRRSLFRFTPHAVGACVSSQPHVHSSDPGAVGTLRTPLSARHGHLTMSDAGGKNPSLLPHLQLVRQDRVP